MKLEYINLVLEDCEIITIDGKDVGFFLVDNISTSFCRLGINCIEKLMICGTFAIEINKNAGKDNNFKRICKYRDITQINFKIDDEKYNYIVLWDSSHDEFNSYQDCYLTEEGHLYIKIDKDKNLFDYFPESYLLDKQSINDAFELYKEED